MATVKKAMKAMKAKPMKKGKKAMKAMKTTKVVKAKAAPERYIVHRNRHTDRVWKEPLG